MFLWQKRRVWSTCSYLTFSRKELNPRTPAFLKMYAFFFWHEYATINPEFSALKLDPLMSIVGSNIRIRRKL